MAWLIAIVCIILVVIFWRVLLPIGVFAVVAIGLLLLYLKVDSDKRERERIQAQQEVQDRINKANAAVRERIAKANASKGTTSEKVWEVSSETDPASGEKVPRLASVLSENGLCTLQVEQRINGTKLTGILCSGLNVTTDKDIEVKFDNRPTSDRMEIKRFSGGSDVYIPSSQSSYPAGRLNYNEFIRRMTDAKRVALLLSVDGAGEQWITFSLLGVVSALVRIGALPAATSSAPNEARPMGNTAPKTAASKPYVPSLPANAELTYSGNDWRCGRGYRRSGNECVTVRLPANAELNYSGNDWKCRRGYRRAGDECVPVGV